MPSLIDLTSFQFGRLTVIERADENDRHGKPMWKCLCECKQEVIVCGMSLRSGLTNSCGCLRREMMREVMNERNHVAPNR